MSQEYQEDIYDDTSLGPESAEEDGSVKNLASKFSQSTHSPAGMGRPPVSPKPLAGGAPKPVVSTKPGVGAKPGKLDLTGISSKIIAPGILSPPQHKTANGTNKTPVSRITAKQNSSFTHLGGAPPGTNPAEIMNMKSLLKKTPVPRPPAPEKSTDAGKVDFKRTLKKPPVAAPPGRSSLKAVSEQSEESTENISTSKSSDVDSSSMSSFTSESSRRDSEAGRKEPERKEPDQKEKPQCEPLPPLSILGPAPCKPRKPHNVKLPQAAATAPPSLPMRKTKVTPANAVADEGISVDSGDFGELYDDVQVENVQKEAKKRISLIPTMDSDEEDSAEDLLYDDTDAFPPPPAIPKVPVPPVPIVLPLSTIPPLPPIQSIPTVPQNSGGSDDGPQEIYDDISLNEETEELYEALDASTEDGQEHKRQVEELDDPADSLAPPKQSLSLSPKKSIPQKNKQEEKIRKEQEKQEQLRRKKEDELRKKRDKEEKKRREKEEKEIRKKFNIRGDIQVLDTGRATHDCGSNYEKMDLICKQGCRVEVIRREGNPPGKWLARNDEFNYGYVDADFIAIEGECMETYDDVIPCDEGDSEEEPQEIYEAFD